MYILQHNGQFWTGDRFSSHIGEALWLDATRAKRMHTWLNSRLHIDTKIVDAPTKDWGEE